MSDEKQPWYVLTMDLAQLRDHSLLAMAILAMAILTMDLAQLRDHARAQLATLLHAPRLLGTGLWSGLGLGLELGLESRLWLGLGLAM